MKTARASLHSVAAALALFGAPLAVGAEPAVHVTGVSPTPGGALSGSQNIHVRVAYESDQPLRFQAAGYLHGANVGSLAMNPSPVYPAGTGEAIVWVFGRPGDRIDELRVRVCDASWRQFYEVAVPAVVEWRADALVAPDAPWVAELVAAQQRAVGEAMRQPPQPTTLLGRIWSALAGILVPVAFFTVPAYPVVQALALWRLRGRARLVALVPLVLMAPIYVYCLIAFSKGSNLWPVFAIFTSPVALLAVGVVWLAGRQRTETGEPGAGG